MSDRFQDALDLVSERGSKIDRQDLQTIEGLLCGLDADSHWEARGTVFEALSLIVSDPEYTGDIDPADLEDADA